MEETLTPLIESAAASGGILLVVVPALVQILKKVPLLTKLQDNNVPVWQLASLGLAIGGAYALGLPTPLITGIMAGLASGKGYDFVKPKK